MLRLLPLLAIILVGCTDRTDKTPASGFSATEYEETADAAVRALIGEDREKFKSLLSPKLLERTAAGMGENAIKKIIDERYIPFFSTFDSFDSNVTATKTTDGDGNRGVAFFKRFVGVDGNQYPYVVYVIDEKGKLTVGNVLINKTYRDVEPEGK